MTVAFQDLQKKFLIAYASLATFNVAEQVGKLAANIHLSPKLK
ncbi:hypothetical protein QRQ56_34820 [Bradyrhizobium sp. U531]